MKKLFSMLLLIVLLTGLVPAAASADDAIGKVSIRIYPDSSYAFDNNQTPLVGGLAEDVYACISSGEVELGDYYMSKGGARASGKLTDETYTFVAQVYAYGGYELTGSTGASVNNEAADIAVSGDGRSATITINIRPKLVGPEIYHNPTDETHNAGDTFSFTASAVHYNTFTWYIKTPYNTTYSASEVYGKVGLYATVSDEGTYVRCNLHNVTENFNGWRVYCVFSGDGGDNWTSAATINVIGADDPYAPGPIEPTPTIEVIETPEPTIWVIDTPAPSIEVIETPAPEDEKEPEVEAAPAKGNHKGLKIAGGIVGGLVVLGGGLIGTQYLIDKNKRKKRAKRRNNRNNIDYRR